MYKKMIAMSTMAAVSLITAIATIATKALLVSMLQSNRGSRLQGNRDLRLQGYRIASYKLKGGNYQLFINIIFEQNFY
jgi:hypothetical protein